MSGWMILKGTDSVVNPTCRDTIVFDAEDLRIKVFADGLWRAITPVFSNYTATAAPATTDDEAKNFQPGSLWIQPDSGSVHICADATVGAAVWISILGTESNGNKIRSGITAPDDTVGIEGDLYVRRNATLDLFQKQSGIYALIGQMKGDKGDPGSSSSSSIQLDCLPVLRPAISNVKLGLKYARISTLGDSTTSSAASGNGRYTTSYPAQLQKLFTKNGIPSAEGFCVPTVADDRWIWASSGWSPTGDGIAGTASAFAASAGSTLLTFEPKHNFDTLVVYYLTGAGRGITEINIDGGPIGTIDTSASVPDPDTKGIIARKTFTGISNAEHVIGFRAPGSTGPVSIVGVEVWDSTIKSLLIGNMGINGATTSNFTTANTESIVQLYGSDGVFIQLGVNNAINFPPGGSIDVFNADIDTITGYSAPADIVLITCVPSDPTYSAGALPNETAQNDSLRTKAAINNWLLIDSNARFGSFALAATMMSDKLHPNSLGYADEAVGIYDGLGRPCGATDRPFVLPSSGVTPGLYTAPFDLSVNSQGLITAAVPSSGGGGNSGGYFPPLNTTRTKSVWQLSNASLGGPNLVMTPAVGTMFNTSGTVGMKYPEVLVGFSSASSAGSVAGITTGYVMTYFNQNPIAFFNFTTGPDITNSRYWVGLCGANQGTSSTPITPLMMLNYDFFLDSTAYWRLVTSDGSATTRKACDIAINPMTEYQAAFDYSTPGQIDFWIDGVFVDRIMTDLPTGTNAACPQCSVTTLNSTAKAIYFRNAWFQG